jgi:hypothetical protein
MRDDGQVGTGGASPPESTTIHHETVNSRLCFHKTESSGAATDVTSVLRNIVAQGFVLPHSILLTFSSGIGNQRGLEPAG